MQSIRRWFFFAAIVMVGCYAGSVLIHLRNSWDIGIRCLFSDRDLGQPGAVGPLVRWADTEVVGPALRSLAIG